jgi:hypothetical protein
VCVCVCVCVWRGVVGSAAGMCLGMAVLRPMSGLAAACTACARVVHMHPK